MECVLIIITLIGEWEGKSDIVASTHHIFFVLNGVHAMFGLADFFLVAVTGDIEVIQREGPESGIELAADVLPHLSRVKQPRSLNEGVHHLLDRSKVAHLGNKWSGEVLGTTKLCTVYTTYSVSYPYVEPVWPASSISFLWTNDVHSEWYLGSGP